MSVSSKSSSDGVIATTLISDSKFLVLLLGDLNLADDCEALDAVYTALGRVGVFCGALSVLLYRQGGLSWQIGNCTWTAPDSPSDTQPTFNPSLLAPMLSDSLSAIPQNADAETGTAWFGYKLGSENDGIVLLICVQQASAQRIPLSQYVMTGIGSSLLAVVRRHERSLVLESQRIENDLIARRHDALLSVLPGNIIEFDRDGRCTYAKTNSISALINSVDNIIGSDISKLLSPEIGLHLRAMMADLDLGLMPTSQIVEQKSADGPKWHKLMAMHHGAGEFLRYVFHCCDVTEEFKQERNITRLAAVAKQTGHLVMITDTEQRIEWVNDAFCRRTGYSLDDIKGKMPGPLVQFDKTDKTTTARIRLALDAGNAVQADLVNRDLRGEEYWIDMYISPLKDPTGQLTGFISVQADITDRVKLSDELSAIRKEAQAAQQQLIDAIEALDDALVIYDAEDHLILCNRQYREFYSKTTSVPPYGTSFEAVLRFSLENRQIKEAIGNEEEWLSNRIAGRKLGNAELEQTLSDGRIIRVVERRTQNGETIGIHSDITQLKLAERRLLNVIEGARVGTWQWDIAKNSQIVNDRWLDMLGYNAYELSPITYSTWLGLIHPDDVIATEQMMNPCFAGLTDNYEAEYRMRHKQGHWIWVMDRGQVLYRGTDGKPGFMAGVQIDIGEQKAREDALVAAKFELQNALDERASAEQRLGDIAAVSDGWLWEQNAELRYSFVLVGDFFDSGGISKESLLGKTHGEWLEAHPDMRAGGEWGKLQETMQARLPFRDFVYRAPKLADGIERWRRMNGSPTFDVGGNFIGYRGAGADITQLYLAKERALESNRAKSMFLANMSHEIRTPLNGVLGMAEVLADSLIDEGHQRMITTIRHSGEVLLNILNDILDMSKIEAGKMELEVFPFVFSEIAKRVQDLHALHAEEKGLAFDILMSSGTELPRLGDPFRVQQILHNLISNAIKFTDEGEVIVTISGRADKPIVIEVRDSGIGMTKEQVSQIYEEFVQADSTVTRRFGGTGLGMAITRTLVEKMNGTINVQSALGQGTRIRVTLPLMVGDIPGPKELEHRLSTNQLAGLTVLAADDNYTNCAVLEALLQRAGAVVSIVSDGKQAVQCWAPGKFDVVLLDIAMPVMDGPAALGAIRALEKEAGCAAIPIVAVTANAMAHQIADYIALGFDSCISKPVNSFDLTHTITSLLRTAQ